MLDGTDLELVVVGQREIRVAAHRHTSDPDVASLPSTRDVRGETGATYAVGSLFAR
ncbi:Uncharacterised protein [Mycobacteroides abscessus subsp. abscessus]|nr:Uncharacterised protein [Mycobacteroides abscessus subsp. abscessus]